MILSPPEYGNNFDSLHRNSQISPGDHECSPLSPFWAFGSPKANKAKRLLTKARLGS